MKDTETQVNWRFWYMLMMGVLVLIILLLLFISERYS